jgi:hypothetical protein
LWQEPQLTLLSAERMGSKKRSFPNSAFVGPGFLPGDSPESTWPSNNKKTSDKGRRILCWDLLFVSIRLFTFSCNQAFSGQKKIDFGHPSGLFYHFLFNSGFYVNRPGFFSNFTA